MKFHEHINSDGEVLILRRIPQDRTTDGNGKGKPFIWPSGVGAVVECPDWNPEPVCGDGLHGWPLGFGLGEGCDYDIIGDIWLVVGCKPEDVAGELEKGAKCKFRKGTIRLEGSFGAAMQFVQPAFDDCVAAMAKEDLSGHSSTAASSGHSSTAASSGEYSKAASSGKYSTAASSGHSSTAASSGHSSTAASSGEYSKAASSGKYSKAASSGHSSKAASSGEYSKAASSGEYCSAEALGENTVSSIAGTGSVRAGKRGAFSVAFYTEETGWDILVGKIGRDGIEADTWYVVRDGKLVKQTNHVH